MINGNWDCNSGGFGEMGIRNGEDGVSRLLTFLWNLKDRLAYRKCCTEPKRRPYLAHQGSLLWA